MENTTVNSQRLSLTNIFSETKEFATRTALYGGSGAFAMRFISPLSWKELGVASVLNSAFVTVSQKIVGSEDLLKHAAATAVGLTLSTLTLTYGAAPLMGRIDLARSRQAVIQLAFLNALGEVVKVAIPKLYDYMTAIKAPTIADELKTLSNKDFDYICQHFDIYAETMPLDNKDFLDALQARWVKNDTMIPTFPSSEEEVQNLSLLDLFKIHTHYTKLLAKKLAAGLSLEARRALHYRFYKVNLPFPEGNTVHGMKEARKSFYNVKVALPKTREDVKSVTENQLSWVYASLSKYGGFSKLSLNTQIALYERFRVAFDGWHFVLKPKMENLEGLSKSTVVALQKYYIKSPDEFIKLPMDVKRALNAQVETELGKDARLHTRWIVPQVKDIPNEGASGWFTYFENNPEQWDRTEMTRPHQQAFKRLFEEKGLSNDLQVRPWSLW